MNKPILTTVDAFPGSGKTHFFKEVTLRAMAYPDYKFVHLYVAPTIALCEEVFNHLKQRCAPEDQNRMHCVWSGEESVDPVLRQKFKLKKSEGPVSKLNALLGTSKTTDPNRIVNPGDVIITTHESFMRIQNTPTAHPVWVFFDEARECVGLKESVSIPRSKVEKCLQLFGAQEVEDTVSSSDTSKVYRFTTLPTLPQLESVFKVSAATKQRGAKDLYNMVRTSDAKRVYVYVLVPDFKASKTSQASTHLNVYPFNNPVSLFDNYARVTVMSAFFKDSQMCHALRPHYQIVPLVKYNIDDDVPKWVTTHRSVAEVIRLRHEKLQKMVGKRLNIVPLLYSEDDEELYSTLQIDTDGKIQRLTKGLLTSGMIVDPETQAKVQAFVDRYDVGWSSKDLISEMWSYWFVMLRQEEHFGQPKTPSHLRNRYIDAWFTKYNNTAVYDLITIMPELFEILKPWMFTPKGDIIFPGRILVERARQLSNRIGANHPPLLIFNSNLGSKLHYMPSEYSTTPPGKDAMFWTRPLVPGTSAVLRERYEDHFEIPKTPKLNGLNTWVHNDHMVHLAALNPSNDLISVFRRILPKYNVTYDFILENLVQTLYRTSLRDPNVKPLRPVYLYILRASITRLLMVKLGQVFKVDSMLNPDDPVLVELSFQSKKRKQARSENISKGKTKYSEATYTQRVNLRNRISYYTKKAKLGLLTKKQTKVLESTKKELATLKPDA